MSSRAVLLPTTGDPYVDALWLNSYKRFWQDANVHLYANLNSGIDAEVMDYTASMFQEAGATIIVHDGLVNHGKAIDELLTICKEEYIFIAEEDYYILKPNNLSKWFSIVEGDKETAVVSYRGSCTNELQQASVRQFGITEPLYQTQSNFWPSLICIHRSKLEATDRWFDSKAFQPGEYVKELGCAFDTQQCGDTFVWTSIQLRAQGLKFVYENQWRLCDVIAKGLGFVPPWIHIGSTSMTVNGALLDKEMRTLNNRKYKRFPSQHPARPPAGGESHLEQCAAFWYLIRDLHPIHPDPVLFNDIYRTAIDDFVAACGLREHYITQYRRMFETYLAPIL